MRRPWQLARFATQAVAVVMIGLVAVALTGQPETLVSHNGELPVALQNEIVRQVPGWYPSLASIATAIQVVDLLAVFGHLWRTEAADYYCADPKNPLTPNLSDVLAARNARLQVDVGGPSQLDGPTP